MRASKINLTVFTCALSVAWASAGVNTYYSNYYRFQSQTSDSAPAGPSNYAFSAFLITNNVGEATAMTITDPNNNILPVAYDNGTILVHYGTTFTSQAAMQTAYPAGNYKFTITAGPLTGQFGILPTAAINFPNRNPYFDSGTFSALQNATAGVAKNISWGSFSNTGAAVSRSISCNIVDMTEISLALTNGGNETYVSDTIPGSKMKSGHRYFYNIVFNSFTQWPNQGFGTAIASVSNAAQTEGRFAVKANPGTIAGQISLESLPYAPGKPILAITRRAGTNTILDTRTITLGYDGYYAYEPTAVGMVDVYFKGPTFLTKKVAGVNLSIGYDNLNATLKNGDCNGDDVVDLTDYTTVAIAFNALPASPNWNATADLNGDSVVDLTDYTIIAVNFNLIGDQP